VKARREHDMGLDDALLVEECDRHFVEQNSFASEPVFLILDT